MREKYNRMYAGVKSWNPWVGCRYGCNYCTPSFQAMTRKFTHCDKCKTYTPHAHPERLNRINRYGNNTIFACSNGDISFADNDTIMGIINTIKEYIQNFPHREFYFQSKNPDGFGKYRRFLPLGHIILLTTLETNRDDNYHMISRAPHPSTRYRKFKDLKWDRKIVTIEPIMDFDHDIFLEWIKDIGPEMVYVGYNSRPNYVQLDEPPLEKTRLFMKALRGHGIPVKEKRMRKATSDAQKCSN